MAYARAPPKNRTICSTDIAWAAVEYTKEGCDAQNISLLRTGPYHVLDGQQSGSGYASREGRWDQHGQANDDRLGDVSRSIPSLVSCYLSASQTETDQRDVLELELGKQLV